MPDAQSTIEAARREGWREGWRAGMERAAAICKERAYRQAPMKPAGVPGSSEPPAELHALLILHASMEPPNA
jgi:hypothetical protein